MGGLFFVAESYRTWPLTKCGLEGPSLAALACRLPRRRQAMAQLPRRKRNCSIFSCRRTETVNSLSLRNLRHVRLLSIFVGIGVAHRHTNTFSALISAFGSYWPW
jgi:hypothetical protein